LSGHRRGRGTAADLEVVGTTTGGVLVAEKTGRDRAGHIRILTSRTAAGAGGGDAIVDSRASVELAPSISGRHEVTEDTAVAAI
jgi:hypothetical protein